MIFTGDLFLSKIDLNIESKILDQINESNYLFSNFENVFEFEKSSKRNDKSAILTTSINDFNNYISNFRCKLIFGLGNNHIHDLDEKGIENLITIFKRNSDIFFTGVGYYQDLFKPLIIEDNNKKIAILTISTDEPEVMSIIAKSNYYGVLDYNDPQLFNIIKETKAKVDFVIVLPHWGKEYIKYPAIQLRKKAYSWIDSGADLVIGHHPHIIQGKEIYNGKSIYYSLGNFIFPNYFSKEGFLSKWEKINCFSIMLKIDFNNHINIHEIGLEFNINDNILKESKNAINLFNNHSIPLNSDKYSNKEYYAIWQKEYFNRLKYEFSFWKKIKKKYFFSHIEHSVLRYYSIKIKKKFFN